MTRTTTVPPHEPSPPQVDCLDGMDENRDEWLLCGWEDEQKCFPKTPIYKCDMGFVCPDKHQSFVSMTQVKLGCCTNP